ncbi:MAG: peptidoglycan-binding protein [Bifidobacteriaceae bacterium]|jgi:peptidoglycan hydrolase-like protein with peptidoglycan-binding domain|nr:peptidoglycan-binding protein [Bifidobacteriaceae bacterium]
MKFKTEKELIKRQKFIIVLTASALVLAIIGLVISLIVKSPEQQILDSQAQYTQITVPIEQKVLQKKIITRANIVSSGTQNISSLLSVSPAIVTDVFISNGDTISNGTFIAEISGRPIIAFQGDTPAYRSINPNDSGKDVSALQNALANLGYYNSQSGVYDDSTQQAISGFYASKGYTLPSIKGKAYIPIGEIAFVSTLPANVEKLSLTKGNSPGKDSSSVVQLNSGNPVAKATISADQKEGLRTGMSVTLKDDLNNKSATGKITDISPQKSSNNSQSAGGGSGEDSPIAPIGGDGSADSAQLGYTITVTPDNIDNSWLNTNVALNIPLASTNAPVLCVPQTAIKVNTDSESYITIKNSDGSTKDITVQTGLIADGYVEIKPNPDIQKGDLAVLN